MLRSRGWKFAEIKVGNIGKVRVGHFTSDSTTLVVACDRLWSRYKIHFKSATRNIHLLPDLSCTSVANDAPVLQIKNSSFRLPYQRL